MLDLLVVSELDFLFRVASTEILWMRSGRNTGQEPSSQCVNPHHNYEQSEPDTLGWALWLLRGPAFIFARLPRRASLLIRAFIIDVLIVYRHQLRSGTIASSTLCMS
jgi:hypothetical protein